MNDILQLKGRFVQKKSEGRPGAPQLPAGSSINLKHLIRLKDDLQSLIDFWEGEEYFDGALISVYYNKIVAKSNRINSYFSFDGVSANESIVGAKFSNSFQKKHIITHYVSIDALYFSIELIKKVILVVDKEFNGYVNVENFNGKNTLNHINFHSYNISKSKFQRAIVDASYIEKFDVENSSINTGDASIVTIYNTGTDTKKLLGDLGIRIYSERILNDTTILLDPNNLQLLLQKAPYLVAMATENISELAPSDFKSYSEIQPGKIPLPSIEPTVGVIDTLFDERVYFAEWVEFHNMLDENIPIESNDYRHGTAVSSIIVDGPSLNPHLDDGCGRFKVRHFGVATNKAFNSFTIIRSIKEIILKNPDIKVWNLSLGSNDEVNENFISAEAAILDEIQYEYDVIFVIAGTNKKVLAEAIEKRIGSPADSINAMVVNSVSSNGEVVPYSRRGIVLSFFTKPDISYYGGAAGEFISVCEPLGKAEVTGTSFAAPWISRKLSYLIDIMGLSKELAKALIVDSAINWDHAPDYNELSMKGYGTVPIRIEDIIKSPRDEIKFVVSGTSEKYDTFNYDFPVPVHEGKHPYIARATLCYFPKCSRNQGVDYTNTELDIYFGRINNKGKLTSINNNKQSMEEDSHYLYEESARKLFRKWDNVKHIKEVLKPNLRAKKVYTNPMWGMSIKTKERLQSRDGEGIKFGVVVTLKEINGVNRIEEFVQQCSLKGWIVNRINVEERIDIFETANETIELE